MAKHDQRILKFLNQNADRAPTITEMMTRLNISISDISDSLGSLQSQGLISKKTNHQGIECWFPNGPQASPQQVPPMQVHAPHLAVQQMATTQIPIQTAAMDNRFREDSRFGSGPHERSMQAPDPYPPAPKAPPVHVSHIPMAEPVYQSRELPPQPEPSFNGSAPVFPVAQPASRGIGVLTFAGGLVLAVVVSTWLGGRMAAKEIKKASTTFVDKKALTDATTAFNDFQEKTKTHVTALEAEVKQLTAQLATTKAAAESLQVAAAKPAETDAPADAKGKAGKKVAAAAPAKAKPAPVAKAKSAKSSAASGALAKAAARGAAMKRKAASRSSSHESSEYSSSSESGTSESSASPSVPEPPGLEELPPPPSE
jgi:hypothetical protein